MINRKHQKKKYASCLVFTDSDLRTTTNSVLSVKTASVAIYPLGHSSNALTITHQVRVSVLPLFNWRFVAAKVQPFTPQFTVAILPPFTHRARADKGRVELLVCHSLTYLQIMIYKSSHYGSLLELLAVP